MKSPAFVLFLIFMVLKLTSVIDWSWWLICLPISLPVAYIAISTWNELSKEERRHN